MSTQRSPMITWRRYWMRMVKADADDRVGVLRQDYELVEHLRAGRDGISAAARIRKAIADLRRSALARTSGRPAGFRTTGSEAPARGPVLAGPGSRYRGEGAIGVSVAAARTILQFGHRVQNLRRVDLLVRAGLEVRGVAAGAVRLVSGETPGRRLAVRLVAARAGDARVVRLVERRELRVRPDRQPGAWSRGMRRRRGW